MAKIAVVYWSETGNTEQMAEGVAEGIRSAGSEVALVPAADFDPATCGNYDAIAFGCPAMGTEVLEEDVFEPMYERAEPYLSGKKIALFGSYDWGDGGWMREWVDRAEGVGANVVSNLIVNLTPGEAELNECREVGKKLAG
jgi:flavodoxin short chain